MWPFKKRADPISIRVSSLSCDISYINARLAQHERFMNYELLDLVRKLDKRVSDLEKILKSKNMCITIVERE